MLGNKIPFFFSPKKFLPNPKKKENNIHRSCMHDHAFLVYGHPKSWNGASDGLCYTPNNTVEWPSRDRLQVTCLLLFFVFAQITRRDNQQHIGISPWIMRHIGVQVQTKMCHKIAVYLTVTGSTNRLRVPPYSIQKKHCLDQLSGTDFH